MTLPRYIAATRPGSHQVVVELDPEVADLVLARLPLPVGDRHRARGSPMRAMRSSAAAATRAAGLRRVVVDVYEGLDAPAFVDEPAFLSGCLALVRARRRASP